MFPEPELFGVDLVIPDLWHSMRTAGASPASDARTRS